MADFSTAVVTNAGVAADATALANGWVINITRVQVGQGILGATDPKTLTNLISPVNLVAPAPTPPNAALIGVNNLVTYQASIRFEVSSAWVTTQFQLTEAGVWATLHGGTEFLYAYAYAIAPDTITNSASSSPVDNQYSFVIPYSNAPTITVNLTLYPTVNLHAGTHLDNGIDPLPTATTLRTGSLFQLSGNVNDVLHGNGTWSAGFLPGMSMDYRGTSAPTGWLLEDGASYPTATYPALFAVIQYTYGGSGANFNVPDSRSRINIGSTISSGGAPPLGAGLSARPTIGVRAGAETTTLAVANLPSHTHGINDSGHNHTLNDPSHTHPVNDPTHAHSISDPGHNHGYVNPIGEAFNPAPSNYLVPNGTPGALANAAGSTVTSTNTTRIGIFGAGTGVYLSYAVTGCYNSPSGTGISIQATGSGAAFSVMNPFMVSLRIIKT